MSAFSKLLPQVNQNYSVSRVWRVLSRASLIKTVYYSLHFGGLILVDRRAHIRLDKNSRIVMGKKAVLAVGIDQNLPQHTLIELHDDARFYVDGTVSICRGSSIVVGAKATLRVGNLTYFNDRCRVLCYKNISIGEHCAFAWGVTIFDTDMHQIYRGGKLQPTHKDVTIADNVWIGANVIVLKGLSIGKGAIVGAGSVVSRSVPAGTISVGSPAKPVAQDATWNI